MTMQTNSTPQAAPIPPPVDVIAPTHTEAVTLVPFGKSQIPASWNRAIKLVEGQIAPDCQIDSIVIGQVFHDKKSWEGKRVEKGVTVTANVSNTVNASRPCKVIWFTEEVPQRDDANAPLPVVVQAPPDYQNHQTIQAIWPKPIRLLNFQANEGFIVTKVQIGPTLFNDPKASEGRRVEKGQIVTTTVSGKTGGNPGMWITEDVPAMVEEKKEAPVVLGQVVHEQAVPVQAVPVPIGQMAIPVAAPPPANMQPGQQYVQHVSGPTMGAQPTHGQQVTQPYQGQTTGYTTVGGGGQVVQHMGGPSSAAQQYAMGPKADEYMILLSRERCRQVANVLRGGIIQPAEYAAICSPILQALAGPPGQMLRPGMNEVAICLTRSHAERIMAMVQGTDYSETQGLLLRFEQASVSQ